MNVIINYLDQKKYMFLMKVVFLPSSENFDQNWIAKIISNDAATLS